MNNKHNQASRTTSKAINRRDALKRTALIGAGFWIGSTDALAGLRVGFVVSRLVLHGVVDRVLLRPGCC